MVVSPSDRAATARVGSAPAAGWLRPVLVANLVGQVGIVLTGGLVRLTDSGLGCPTWPECTPGSYTPVVTQPEGIHKYVEFGNRLLSFVVGALALAALLAIVAHLRSGGSPGHERRLRLLGAFPLAGVAVQAALGGATVLTELHPAVVAAHFLVSMVLIAGSTVLLLEATATAGAGRAPDAAPHEARELRAPLRWLALAIGAVASAVLVLGTVVTGSGPHSGDAQDPARFGFDPATVSWLHADAVWLFIGLVVALLLGLTLTGESPQALRRTRVLLAVTLAQGLVGYAQYLTDLPVALVALHMLGASLLVIATTATLHAVFAGGAATQTAQRAQTGQSAVAPTSSQS